MSLQYQPNPPNMNYIHNHPHHLQNPQQPQQNNNILINPQQQHNSYQPRQHVPPPQVPVSNIRLPSIKEMIPDYVHTQQPHNPQLYAHHQANHQRQHSQPSMPPTSHLHPDPYSQHASMPASHTSPVYAPSYTPYPMASPVNSCPPSPYYSRQQPQHPHNPHVAAATAAAATGQRPPQHLRHDSISSSSSNGSVVSASTANSSLASPPSSSPPSSSCSSSSSSSSSFQQNQGKKRRGNLPRHVTEILRSWLNAHVHHPYPTDEEKADLMQQTGLTLNQISNWFINARRRRLPAMNRGKVN